MQVLTVTLPCLEADLLAFEVTGYGSVISKCQVTQLLKKLTGGHLKPGSVTQVGTMAQKLLQRKVVELQTTRFLCQRRGSSFIRESFTHREP